MKINIPIICKDMRGLFGSLNLAQYSHKIFGMPYNFMNNCITSAILKINVNRNEENFPLETIISIEEKGLLAKELNIERWLTNLFIYPEKTPTKVYELKKFFDNPKIRNFYEIYARKESKLDKNKILAYFFKRTTKLPQAYKMRTTYYIWSQEPINFSYFLQDIIKNEIKEYENPINKTTTDSLE